MNSLKKGIIVPILVIIIALLIIGGGFYFYNNNRNIRTDTSYSDEKQKENTSVFTNFQHIKTDYEAISGTVLTGDKIKFTWSGCPSSTKDISINLISVFDQNPQPITIAKNLNNNGEYTWAIPQQITGVFRASISSENCKSTLSEKTNIEIQKAF